MDEKRLNVDAISLADNKLIRALLRGLIQSKVITSGQLGEIVFEAASSLPDTDKYRDAKDELLIIGADQKMV